MNKEIPIVRYFISMLLLWICYYLLLLFVNSKLTFWGPLIYTFLSYAIINVAYTRKVKRRNMVAWLACLWIIPFPALTSLLLASIIAMFGKTEDDDNNHISDYQRTNAIPDKIENNNIDYLNIEGLPEDWESPADEEELIKVNTIEKQKYSKTKIFSLINSGMVWVPLTISILLACISLIKIKGTAGIELMFTGMFYIVNIILAVLIIILLYNIFKRIITFIHNSIKFISDKSRNKISSKNNSKFIKYLLVLLPKNDRIKRLCLVSGILLLFLSLAEISQNNILLKNICLHSRYGCFGKLNIWETILLCVSPFLIAKVIEFIIGNSNNEHIQK